MDRRGLLNDPIETMTLVLDGRQAQMWTAIPAIVTKVNFAAMTIECQPAIQGFSTDQNNNTTFANMPLLVDVPIVFPSAGGFTLTLPITAGDEVLVLFSSRCIDSWWQSGGIQSPAEYRMHDLSDGFAFLGPKSQPKVISGISTTGAQLRKNDGSSYIELSADGKIKIVASEVDITGNLNVSGAVIGDSATVPVSLTTHVHPGVTSGGSDTGTPI